MITGRATSEGTARYAARHARAHSRHWRPALGLTVSSVGMGSYLGNADPVTDGRYADAVVRALELGINVLDSAVNYRYQRSERAIGRGLAEAIRKGAVARDEVLVCTKGGFITGDAEPPTREYFEATYVRPGLLAPSDLAAGGHCLAPKFIRHELEQSRKNLGLETIDLYYLHNPETQLPKVGETEYYKLVTAAFRELEAAADAGLIAAYGTATWHGYRVSPAHESHVSLERTLACAVEAGGEKHRFRAIQMPLNLGLPEALVQPSQSWKDRDLTAVDAAREAGLAVFTSVPLMQGQLLGRFAPDFKAKFPGMRTDAQRCLQFARSVPGVSTPLVGMRDVEHVEENAAIVTAAPFTEAEFAAAWPRAT